MEQLPDVGIASRPAHAHTLWTAVIKRVPVNGSIVTFGDALAVYELTARAQIRYRLTDQGYLVGLSLNQLISEIWPVLAGSTSGHYDNMGNDPVLRHGYNFRQKIAQHLRGSVNLVCLRPGNIRDVSVWWVRSTWSDESPVKRVFETIKPAELDEFKSIEVPRDIEIAQLRSENTKLSSQVSELKSQVASLRAMLRAVGNDV